MTRRLIVVVLLILASAAAWAHWPRPPIAASAQADQVVVRKAARVLELYRGSQLIRSYEVSLGRQPIGLKRQQGDRRTPEGNYVIDYHKNDSGFHMALHISYPSPQDTVTARSRGADPGGLIMIHGLKNGLGFLGRVHTAVDWTDGCIAVTNSEIEEIARVVPDGTPIHIEP